MTAYHITTASELKDLLNSMERLCKALIRSYDSVLTVSINWHCDNLCISHFLYVPIFFFITAVVIKISSWHLFNYIFDFTIFSMAYKYIVIKKSLVTNHETSKIHISKLFSFGRYCNIYVFFFFSDSLRFNMHHLFIFLFN